MKQLKTAIMYGAAAIVACVVRVCQLLFMTDSVTGFFYPRYETLGTLLTVLYLLIFAVLAVVAFLEVKGSLRRTVRSWPRVIVLALAGLLTAAELASLFAVKAAPLAVLLRLVLIIGCAAFFFTEAAEGLEKINISRSFRGWMCVLPAAFWLMNTVTAFSQYMGVANISENVFDLGAMGFLTLFFLLYGKEINGVEPARSIRLIVPVGLIASLLCLICSFPRLIVALFGQGVHGSDPKLLYIAMAAAVLFLLPRRVDK